MLRQALRGCIATTVVFSSNLSHNDREKGIDGYVGNTPLIYIKSLSEATGCKIYGKAEFMNPTGSVKDRAALGIIEEAEAKGLLRPGGTIVEGTGGNTGIALAQLGISRGYKVILTMPNKTSKEKVDYMRQLGAEVHLQPPVPYSDPRHFARLAESMGEEMGEGTLHTNQFENMANFRAHFGGTGPEIWSQTGRKIDIFVTASGTGGTLAGVSAFLKKVQPSVQCLLADCAGSSLFNFVSSGGVSWEASPGSTVMEGIGSNRLTANFNAAEVDGAVTVSDQEAVAMAYHLFRQEGLYVGPSAALNVAAATKMALRNKDSGKVIVTILCDGGERYASKLYDADWLRMNNLTPTTSRTGGVQKGQNLLDFISSDNSI